MDNLGNIMNELCVYVQDINNILKRKSIEILGKIAQRLQESLSPVLSSLTIFIQMEQD